MSRTWNCSLCVAVMLALVIAVQPVAAEPATQRPIEEWVDAQGTFCLPDGEGGCVIFVPPLANFLGWTDPGDFLGASVDYAGIADAWLMEETGGEMSLGTEFHGGITERALPDGRAVVHVRLHTTNALSWAFECTEDMDCDFGGAPTVFGVRAPEVLEGAEPCLGQSFLKVKFINSAPGAPMPDLMQLIFAPEYEEQFPSMVRFVSATPCFIEDGTPATLKVTQIATFAPPMIGFPVENIEIIIGDDPDAAAAY